MINKRNMIIFIGMIVIILGYWYGCLGDTGKNKIVTTGDNPTKVGKMLVPFTLTSLAGSPVTVSSSGKIVVINFWTTWCAPCQDEMPDMDGFAKHNQEKVDFYGVNLQESPEIVGDFMYKNKYTMPVLLDKEGEIANLFQVGATPTTIIINKHGMIKHRKSGGMTRYELEGIINSL